MSISSPKCQCQPPRQTTNVNPFAKMHHPRAPHSFSASLPPCRPHSKLSNPWNTSSLKNANKRGVHAAQGSSMIIHYCIEDTRKRQCRNDLNNKQSSSSVGLFRFFFSRVWRGSKLLCRRGVHHLRATAMATQILPSASNLINLDSPSPSQRTPPLRL
jgi:hypothetical protein